MFPANITRIWFTRSLAEHALDWALWVQAGERDELL